MGWDVTVSVWIVVNTRATEREGCGDARFGGSRYPGANKGARDAFGNSKGQLRT
mgnify:FL=1|jgi:hypothetical protein